MELLEYWDEITFLAALVSTALTVVTIGVVLTIKKETMSALAWCLVVFFLPVVGVLLFVFLGYQQVHRPVLRKLRHKRHYRSRQLALASHPLATLKAEPGRHGLAQLAERFGASPATVGNQITFYHDGPPAYTAMRDAIVAARKHIHLEFFIVQPDATGRQLFALLAEKAKQGVEVRLLYDAMGSHKLHRWGLRTLCKAGARCSAFLPLDPLRRKIQLNMRNHRKILVTDGEVAFTGGLNIGDEYLGLVPRFGYWRDTQLRVTGPIVADLQRVFIEDWDFAAKEDLRQASYFPPPVPCTPNGGLSCAAQVIDSGPDQALKGIREIYFAALGQARRRLWIATPYFVPDAGLLDALILAGYQGVDVRLLFQYRPDKWVPYFAGRYYFPDLLDAGVKVYQYTKGMLHAKVLLMDDDWASVGTANFDNRSMHLNFEVTCLLHTPAAVAELEKTFCDDLTHSIQLDRQVFAERPFAGRLIENACRLLSPIL